MGDGFCGADSHQARAAKSSWVSSEAHNLFFYTSYCIRVSRNSPLIQHLFIEIAVQSRNVHTLRLTKLSLMLFLVGEFLTTHHRGAVASYLDRFLHKRQTKLHFSHIVSISWHQIDEWKGMGEPSESLASGVHRDLKTLKTRDNELAGWDESI